MMKRSVLALIVFVAATGTAAAGACHERHLREDIKSCSVEGAPGAYEILTGAQDNKIDALDDGFTTCMDGHTQAMTNFHSCSVQQRIDAAREVLNVHPGDGSVVAHCRKKDLREDISWCVNHPNQAGHYEIITGAQDNKIDALDDGFVACMDGRVSAIANFNACSETERMQQAVRVLNLD